MDWPGEFLGASSRHGVRDHTAAISPHRAPETGSFAYIVEAGMSPPPPAPALRLDVSIAAVDFSGAIRFNDACGQAGGGGGCVCVCVKMTVPIFRRIDWDFLRPCCFESCPIYLNR